MAQEIEVQMVTDVPDAEVAGVVANNKLDPNYLSHRIVKSEGGLNDIEFTFKK